MRIALPLIVLAATAGATAAVAQQRHDSNAPLNFDAGHIELQDKQGRAILSGGVKVVQAEMTLTASKMTIAYSGQALNGASPQASRIDASGNVVVTRPDQTARGAYGVYDINRRTVIMLGGVTLTQGGNTVSGSRLTINLDTGKAVIDGGSGAVGGTPGTTSSSGGRVTGTFTVPKRNDSK
ncbi:MAG: OstA family protein [Sphingomonas sp.]|uniref:LptA/OstA family protein n=1 Tax=Sphingomonas sp. TaxID=28214 RepID=UPI001AC88E91|nr:LptA/OstA family protein [Sphingomonas sp.]MBN8809207.1 OstA family protein [Sphingomonas sp.]